MKTVSESKPPLILIKYFIRWNVWPLCEVYDHCLAKSHCKAHILQNHAVTTGSVLAVSQTPIFEPFIKEKDHLIIGIDINIQYCNTIIIIEHDFIITAQ